MSDVFLATRLQAALGDAYRLERELPAGGMSRLFMATETSLNREVVIKVLPPELTSEVSAARFKHEIDLAAHLQHPHVLSILAAGSKDDLLYYVMPFVPGESLRHRLATAGRLPIAEAIQILREVADALAYAHRKGVVHRDIKPENILLLEGHAVIADFGVARAIVAARSGSITQSGTSVGTPAYMAPEQAAAEPNIDARADIYALGIVGYEMLTGALPFTGSSAQAVLAAHLTEPPPPVSRARADTPPAVSAAITRALAKAPADRFGDAGEFRDALNSSRATPARSKRLVIAAGATIAALVVAGATLALRHRNPDALDADLLAVAPFDITDPSLQLWHEGMVDVLSRDLDGAGALRTVPPSAVIQRWVGRADRASAVALGRASGARIAVVGSLSRSGSDSVRATLEIVDVRNGHTVGEMIERRASAARIDGLADSLTVEVLRELGKTQAVDAARLSSVGTTSLPALKSYLAGERFFRHGQYDSAQAYYDRALATDSTFAIAALHASAVAGWIHDPMEKSYAARAVRFNHGLSPRDSILIRMRQLDEIAAEYRYPALVNAIRDLFTTARLATERYPDDAEMWYGLGELQTHKSAWESDGASPLEIQRTLDKSVALDSSFMPAYIHLVELGFRYGRATGRRYLKSLLAHSAAAQHAGGEMPLVDVLTDSVQSLTQSADSALRASTIDQLRNATVALRQYSDSSETMMRITHELMRRNRIQPIGDDPQGVVGSVLAMRGRAREAIAFGVHQSPLADLVLLEALPEKMGDSALAADRAAGKPFCMRCQFGIWGIRGDTLSIQHFMLIRDSLIRDDTTGQGAKAKPYMVALARAFEHLARRDTAAAMRAFFSLPDSLCAAEDCALAWLVKLRLLESHGRYIEAAKMLDTRGVPGSALDVYVELERGHIAEKLGDRPRAIDAYSFVAGIWQNADAPLQEYVADARTGLKRLSGERGGVPIEPNTAH